MLSKEYLTMSDMTIELKGWNQLEWLCSDRWDMTVKEALTCMVEHKQSMGFLNDITGLHVLEVKTND